TDEVIAYRGRDYCAGIEQELSTCLAREVLLAERVAAVAEGIGSHPEQPAAFFIPRPRQQCGVFRHELPQTFDVIIMDHAVVLGYGPFQPLAQALLYFFHQILPAWKSIFARQHQLGITL